MIDLNFCCTGVASVRDYKFPDQQTYLQFVIALCDAGIDYHVIALGPDLKARIAFGIVGCPMIDRQPLLTWPRAEHVQGVSK